MIVSERSTLPRSGDFERLAVPRGAAAAADRRATFERTADKAWAAFAACLAEAGEAVPERPESLERAMGIVRDWVRRGMVPGWRAPTMFVDCALALTQYGRLVESFEPAMPPRPTNAQPGTAAKLRLLAERVELGLDLWHPADLCCGEGLGIRD